MNNHKKNCDAIETRNVQQRVKQNKTFRKKPNVRVQQLKSNWSDSLEIRERCNKCGRSNYFEEDLDKHQARCRGTLMNYKSKFECPYCVNPKVLFNTELAMRRHVGTTHAKEALEDGWDFEPKKVKTVGLAMKHLFR